MIAFPKTQRGQDLLVEAPTPVTEKQLRELHIRVRAERRGEGRLSRTARVHAARCRSTTGPCMRDLRACAAAPRALLAVARCCARRRSRTRAATPDELPTIASPSCRAEARDVLAQIDRGGPFRYERDGVVFGNREHILPAQPRGYYHEYTVPHAAARTTAARGASCAAAPQRAPDACFYSDDHYQIVPRGSANEQPPDLDQAVDDCGVRPWSGAPEPHQAAGDARAPAHFAAVDLAQGARSRHAVRASSTARSSCPSISATTSTRSPTCSRTATGSASAAR